MAIKLLRADQTVDSIVWPAGTSIQVGTAIEIVGGVPRVAESDATRSTLKGIALATSPSGYNGEFTGFKKDTSIPVIAVNDDSRFIAEVSSGTPAVGLYANISTNNDGRSVDVSTTGNLFEVTKVLDDNHVELKFAFFVA
jgi:hypothetical protein